MKQFRDWASRIVTETCDFEVEAENEAEARVAAEDRLFDICPDDWATDDVGDSEIDPVIELRATTRKTPNRKRRA